MDSTIALSNSMPKPAATTVFSCRMPIGWLCAALSALALLLPPVLAAAATPDPNLQRSEQLDARRIGRVSDTERSVLRIEWRAAVTGAEEARTVQEMLDSLRRMEITVGEINRLIGSIPVRKPAIAVIAAEPPESDGYDLRLILANIAAVCLLALWWLRRRNSARHSGATTAPNTVPEANPPDANLPTMAAIAKAAPTPAVEEETRGKATRTVPRTMTDAIKTEPGPTPAPEPEQTLKRTAPPELAATRPSAAPSVVERPGINFMLEEADPEAVARENAKSQQLQAMNRRKTPEKQQKSDVEPTLELAGIMLSMGLEQGAAQALVEYTEANPREALHHLLKLLDIYRNSGHRNDFEEAAEKLRQNFNIQAEDWIVAQKDKPPTLENFSRVSAEVQQRWTRPAECIDYLRHLLEDTREGSRAGFPQPVAEEILLLIAILRETSGANQAAGL